MLTPEPEIVDPVSTAELSTSQRQVWFGPADRPLCGWVAAPASGRARGGVLLCPPVGEEGRAAYRTMRRLADGLAAVGFVVLRFDYDGLGDSAGLQDDPERVESWVRSIHEARTFLEGAGVERVSAVGMRLGATLAARAAADESFDGLVLWDPCHDGRAFLREGEALYAFGEHAGEATDEAFRHTPGFQYDAATAAALRGLSLRKLPVESALAARALLLTRDDRPTLVTPELPALAALGERLTTGIALDQDLLLDRQPSDCEVPTRAIAVIGAWLAAGSTATAEIVLPPSAPAVVAAEGPGSAQVRERMAFLGQRGLATVITEPAGAIADGTPWLVLINVAAEHHVGPGRRWVEFARRWAGQGYRCLRVDLSGIGDSPGLPEDVTYAPAWLEDLPTAIDVLAEDGAPVVLIGLCSGAHTSFEAALRRRVDGIFALNPRMTMYDAAKGTAVFTQERKAGIVPNRPFAVLGQKHRVLSGGMWRLYRQVAIWHAPYLALRRVVVTGTQVMVMACDKDARHFAEVLVWQRGLRRLLASGRLEFERDNTLGHSLLGRTGQFRARDRVEEFLASHFPVPR